MRCSSSGEYQHIDCSYVIVDDLGLLVLTDWWIFNKNFDFVVDFFKVSFSFSLLFLSSLLFFFFFFF